MQPLGLKGVSTSHVDTAKTAPGPSCSDHVYIIVVRSLTAIHSRVMLALDQGKALPKKYLFLTDGDLAGFFPLCLIFS